MLRIQPAKRAIVRLMSSDWGSGAGKGGGSGGSIRDAGGSFGKMESAHEEQYFRKQQAQQLEELKKHFSEDIKRHEELIKQHEEAIKASKETINQLSKKQP